MSLSQKIISKWVSERITSDYSENLDKTTEHVANLPGLENWIPDSGMNVLDILSLGAAISRIDRDGCRPLLSKIAKSLLSTGKPNPEDMAELNSAALLSTWASSVHCISTLQNQNTPDFKAFIGNLIVECETTNSEPKRHNITLKDRAHSLSTQLQVTKSLAGLRVGFTDDAEENDFLEVLRVAPTLFSGESKEVAGKWFIQAYDSPIQPNPDANYPAWWAKQYVNQIVLRSSAQVSLSSKSPQIDNQSTIEVNWCLSTKSYLNSLSKKEDAKQASGTKPFIVLCNVTQLPGAFGWYQDNFPPILSTWSPKLSAVILFRCGIESLDSLKLEYQIYLNPNAAIELPIELRSHPNGFLKIPFD